MMKCEFLDNAAFSEEENYALMANVNKDILHSKEHSIHCDIPEKPCHVCRDLPEIPSSCNISSKDTSICQTYIDNDITNNEIERNGTSKAVPLDAFRDKHFYRLGDWKHTKQVIKRRNYKRRMKRRKFHVRTKNGKFSRTKKRSSSDQGPHVQQNHDLNSSGSEDTRFDDVGENNLTEEETTNLVKNQNSNLDAFAPIQNSNLDVIAPIPNNNLDVLANSNFQCKRRTLSQENNKKIRCKSNLVDNSYEKTKPNILKKCTIQRTLNPLLTKEGSDKCYNEKPCDFVSEETTMHSVSNFSGNNGVVTDEQIQMEPKTIFRPVKLPLSFFTDDNIQPIRFTSNDTIAKSNSKSYDLIPGATTMKSVSEELRKNVDITEENSKIDPKSIFRTVKLPSSFFTDNNIQPIRFTSNDTITNSNNQQNKLNTNGAPININSSTDQLESESTFINMQPSESKSNCTNNTSQINQFKYYDINTNNTCQSNDKLCDEISNDTIANNTFQTNQFKYYDINTNNSIQSNDKPCDVISNDTIANNTFQANQFKYYDINTNNSIQSNNKPCDVISGVIRMNSVCEEIKSNDEERTKSKIEAAKTVFRSMKIPPLYFLNDSKLYPNQSNANGNFTNNGSIQLDNFKCNNISTNSKEKGIMSRLTVDTLQGSYSILVPNSSDNKNANIAELPCDETISSACFIAQHDDIENYLPFNLSERQTVEKNGLNDPVSDEMKTNKVNSMKLNRKEPRKPILTEKLSYEDEEPRNNLTSKNLPYDEARKSLRTKNLPFDEPRKSLRTKNLPFEDKEEEIPGLVCDLKKCNNTNNMYRGEDFISFHVPVEYNLGKMADLVLGKSNELSDKVEDEEGILTNKDKPLTTSITSIAQEDKCSTPYSNKSSAQDARTRFENTSDTLTFPISIKFSKLKEQKPGNIKGTKSKSSFHCNICGKQFKYCKAWLRHNIHFHSTSCAFCQAKFLDAKSYRNHIRSCHTPSVLLSKLIPEDFQFFASNSLNSNKSVCILCKSKFLTREKCIDHIEKSHYLQVFKWSINGVINKHVNPYFLKKFALAINCPLCKLYFGREHDFHAHMESYHSSHSFCLQCNTYILNIKFAQHEKKHLKEEIETNEAEIEYSCDSCHISCTTEEDFTSHTKSILCVHCDTILCNEKDLIIHQTEEHIDRLFGICSSCDTGFYNKQDLLDHMIETHSFLPFPGYELSVCKYCQLRTASSIAVRYFTRDSLESHLLSHSIISSSSLSNTLLSPGTYFDVICPNNILVPQLECILCSTVDKKINTHDIVSFIQHVTYNHADSSLGFCIPCGLKCFRQITDAVIHFINTHFTSDGSVLKCLTCNSFYSNSKSALLHIISTHLILLGQIPSHINDVFFTGFVNSLDICRNLNQSSFRCEICSFDANGFLSYFVHLNKIHNVLRLQIKCKRCKTTHETIRSFVYHSCKKDYMPRQKIHHKATVLGVVHKYRDASRQVLIQGKYSGITGEHSYALLPTETPNSDIVHQDHCYY